MLAAIELNITISGSQKSSVRMQFEVEIVDTTARDNYNKVVIHKKKCVPCGPENKIVLGQQGKHVNNNNNFQRYNNKWRDQISE